jgi:surface protein
MGQTFFNCVAFNQSLNSWDVSSVTTMSSLFSGCSIFNGNITSWVPSSVTTFYNIFLNCSAFNQVIGEWNISSATTLYAMFSGCTVFNQPLNNWNLTQVTTIVEMFQDCSAFNANISTWDTSSVLSFTGIFKNCTVFNQDISSWDTSAGVAMNSMFLGCSEFNQDISGWDFSSVTNSGNIFLNCDALNQNFGASNIFDMPSWSSTVFRYVQLSLTNTDRTLQGITEQSPVPTNITVTIDISNIWYYSSVGETYKNLLVNTYGWTFTNVNLKTTSSFYQYTLPTSNYSALDSTIVNTDGSFTFLQKSTLISGSNTIVFYDYEFSDTGVSPVDGLYFPGTLFQTKRVTIDAFGNIPLSRQKGQFSRFAGTFPSSSDVPSLLSSSSCSNTFYRAINFNSDISGWDVSTVTDMSQMFVYTQFNYDISLWDTTLVTDMKYMFYNNTSFNQNISGWTVTNVTSFWSMFDGATSFDHNLGSWDIRSATTMNNMLNNTGLSVTNFSNTLIEWVADTNTPTQLLFGASNLTLNASGETAKTTLENTYAWVVTLTPTITIDRQLPNNYTLTGQVVCKDPVYIMSGTNDYISGLSVFAGLGLRYTPITIAEYSIIEKDVIIGVNYAGIVALTLPPAIVSTKLALDNISSGKYFIILDSSGSANTTTRKITITAQGSDTILGLTTIALDSAYKSLTLISDGVSKWISV